MRVLCVFGRHAYGDPARGEGYEHANFIAALTRLGHEVQLFDSLDRSAHPDFSALNRGLVEQVERWRPDLVFCVLMHYEIWTETLEVLRSALGAAVLNWGTDDSWKYAQFAPFIAPHVDLYATTSPAALQAAKRDGLENVVLTQWAADDRGATPPLPARECRYPVSFVGAAYGNRRRWVERLAGLGVEVACFGHGWPAGPVATADVRRIARESVISLNFADSGLHWRRGRLFRSRQIKARTFEIPGAGGFLLTESADGLERCYRVGAEVDVFSDEAEAVQKIRRYLDDPEQRDVMARAAHERTLREHTYVQRFQPLLAEALRRKAPRPVGASRDLADAFASHTLPWWLKALSALLATPAMLLFGAKRGRRAARRLLYEISWRVCGAHTYSARGWPGRAFYRES